MFLAKVNTTYEVDAAVTKFGQPRLLTCSASEWQTRRGYSRYSGANTGQRRRPTRVARSEPRSRAGRVSQCTPSCARAPRSHRSATPDAEPFAHTRHTIRFLHTAACSRQSCFDTPLGCESLRDDIQVRADIGRQGNAHRTR